MEPVVPDGVRSPDGLFCTNCGEPHAGTVNFCSRCGAPQSVAAAGSPTVVTAASGTGSSDVLRSPSSSAMAHSTRRWLRNPGVWAGLVGVLVLGIAIWTFTRPGIEFIPNTLRCDGTPRIWIFRLPTGVSNITVEMREDGPTGHVVSSDSANVSSLSTYRQSDGSYRAESSTYDAWECRQPSGHYAMVIRDSSTGAAIATGEFSIDAN